MLLAASLSSWLTTSCAVGCDGGDRCTQRAPAATAVATCVHALPASGAPASARPPAACCQHQPLCASPRRTSGCVLLHSWACASRAVTAGRVVWNEQWSGDPWMRAQAGAGLLRAERNLRSDRQETRTLRVRPKQATSRWCCIEHELRYSAFRPGLQAAMLRSGRRLLPSLQLLAAGEADHAVTTRQPGLPGVWGGGCIKPPSAAAHGQPSCGRAHRHAPRSALHAHTGQHAAVLQRGAHDLALSPTADRGGNGGRSSVSCAGRQRRTAAACARLALGPAAAQWGSTGEHGGMQLHDSTLPACSCMHGPAGQRCCGHRVRSHRLPGALRRA